MAAIHKSILVTPEIARALRAASRQRGRWESSLAGEALEALLFGRPLSKPGSLYHRLKAIGFIGAMKGGPRDLSTNKKYFEGFGESRSSTHRRNPRRLRSTQKPLRRSRGAAR